ncbi:hypothetical protein, partial [Streptomyces sp. NPDC093060]|uniref:hypothetical protein n=1 Tax=Streptomyces sp. NPDC093060 TaxID=3366019 RepID=UPI00380D232F
GKESVPAGSVQGDAVPAARSGAVSGASVREGAAAPGSSARAESFSASEPSFRKEAEPEGKAGQEISSESREDSAR